MWLSREEAQTALCDLYSKFDSDCDRRLTVLDRRDQCEHPPCALTHTMTLEGSTVTLRRLHQASQLATELAEALGTASKPATAVEVNLNQAFKNPVEYLRDRIRTRFWTALTRTISASRDELRHALLDEKQGERARDDLDWCRMRLPQCSETRKSASANKEQSNERVRMTEPQQYLYVPVDDKEALALYAPLNDPPLLHVRSVPTPITAEWVRSLTNTQSHGLLTLSRDSQGHPEPFVVPGGRFNEMYGWDSYFISEGLVESGLTERARQMANHQAYEIWHYGKVLNANRTYYLTRSQPPFFPALVRLVLESNTRTSVTSKQSTTIPQHVAQLDEWRRDMIAAAEREYSQVWAAAPRLTPLCEAGVCLARYFGEGIGQPPEVEPGHFAAFYQMHALEHDHCSQPAADDASQRAFIACSKALEVAYTNGTLNDPEIEHFFVNDRCVRESGHDTTFRWFVDGEERCTDHATIDLNSLLLRYELDLAGLHRDSQLAKVWCERAEHRARLIQRYLWDDATGVFVDYDFIRRRQTRYLSATALYPLWAGGANACQLTVLRPEQAERLRTEVLERLEEPGGLLAAEPCTPRSSCQNGAPTLLDEHDGLVRRRTPARQWDAPNGWAPHQMLAWAGLRQHGFEADAQRLAYRWLLLITESAANYHGTVPEKFDVIDRTHRVFAEYGNVNTDFAYIAKEGFGWMNASFLVGLRYLTPTQRQHLEALDPVDVAFPTR